MLNEEDIKKFVGIFTEPENMPAEAQALIVHFAVCMRSIVLSLESIAEGLDDG